MRLPCFHQGRFEHSSVCSPGWWETQGPCGLGRETLSLAGWLTLSSFVNQAPFPLIRRNSPTACVEPSQKHVKSTLVYNSLPLRLYPLSFISPRTLLETLTPVLLA